MSFNLIKKAYAATLTTDQLLSNILANIINPLITVMMGVAVVYFLWGVFQFVRNAESPDKRKEGGMHMLWGIIGLFVMISAYGILNLILGTIRTPIGFN